MPAPDAPAFVFYRNNWKSNHVLVYGSISVHQFQYLEKHAQLYHFIKILLENSQREMKENKKIGKNHK